MEDVCETRACVIDWPQNADDDEAWDKAFEDYSRALMLRDDRYSADVDRMTTTY